MNNIAKIREELQKQNITKIYAYSRKSREDLEEDSLEKHRELLFSFAQKLGVEIEIFEEIGSSETLEREKLNQVREKIRNKIIRALVVYRLDRLTRKITDNERLLAEFKFNDLILLEANREKIVDYNELLGIKLESIMSDLYQEQVKRVLTEGRRKSIELFGNHQGESPLGYVYCRESKKLKRDKNAEIIEEIFERFLSGESPNQIAFKLNNKGLRTKEGANFRGEHIRRILKNEKYMGTQIFGRQEWFKDEKGKKYSKIKDKEKWIIYKNAHEKIIDEKDFIKVQEKLKERARTPPRSLNNRYTLTMLVRCGKCKKIMTLQKREGKPANVRSCNHVNFLTGKACGNPGIKSEIVEKYIKDKIWEIRPKLLDKILGEEKGKKPNKNNKKNKLEKLNKKEKELNKKIENLYDLMIETGKKERLIKRAEALEKELEEVKKEILEIMEEDGLEEEEQIIENFLKEADELLSFPFIYNQKSEEEKNKFLRKYIEYVEVLDKKIVNIKFTEDVEALIK